MKENDFYQEVLENSHVEIVRNSWENIFDTIETEIGELHQSKVSSLNPFKFEFGFFTVLMD